MMSRTAASLGTNVITLDQALETPPWKSTASGMNELLLAGRLGEAARCARANKLRTVLGWSEAARLPRRCRIPRFGDHDGGPGSWGLARNRAARLRVS